MQIPASGPRNVVTGPASVRQIWSLCTDEESQPRDEQMCIIASPAQCHEIRIRTNNVFTDLMSMYCINIKIRTFKPFPWGTDITMQNLFAVAAVFIRLMTSFLHKKSLISKSKSRHQTSREQIRPDMIASNISLHLFPASLQCCLEWSISETHTLRLQPCFLKTFLYVMYFVLSAT